MKNTPLSLRDLQSWMRWIIVDPRGVTPALNDPNPQAPTHPDRYTEPVPSARNFIEESGRINTIQRLDIYAEGYFSRIVEVLGEDFPTTLKLLGEDDFLRLVAEYLKDFPSQETNIGEVGQFLPTFLQTGPFKIGPEFLRDLVVLEWSFVQSFYANPSPEFDIESLKTISEERWPLARFQIDDSVKLLKLQWPVGDLWKNKDSLDFDKIKNEFSPRESSLLLFRHQGEVSLEEISAPEFRTLSLLNEGLSLGEVIQMVTNEGLETGPLEWFAKWTSNGLIRKIYFERGDLK